MQHVNVRGGAVVLIALAVALAIPGVGGVAAQADDETVSEVNTDLEASNDLIETELNANLEEVDPVDPIEPVDPGADADAEADRLESEFDRLEREMLDTVVAEINARSPIGEVVDPSDAETTDDARDAAQKLEDEYGSFNEDAIRGANFMRNVSDAVDSIEVTLNDAAAELRGQSLGTVTGTVTDADGDPVAGVEVTVESTGATATTGEDGTYEIRTVTGEQTLVFEHDEHGTTESTVEVAGDETAAHDAAYDDGGDGGDSDDGGDSVPGFGAVGALLAIVGVLALAGRHRQ